MPRWEDITQKPEGFVDADSHMLIDQAASNPDTLKLPTSAQQAIMYTTNSKLVIAYNLSGTINYLNINLDGSDTSWTNSSSAP